MALLVGMRAVPLRVQRAEGTLSDSMELPLLLSPYLGPAA